MQCQYIWEQVALQLATKLAHIANNKQSFVCVATFRFLVSHHRYQFIADVLEIRYIRTFKCLHAIKYEMSKYIFIEQR